MDTRNLKEVLQEFPEVFAPGLGTYSGPPVKLHMYPQSMPICLKARKIPIALRRKVDAEIDRLCECGVLVPVSTTEWGTPVVPVLKPDGSIRLCGDYKHTINKSLRKDHYPVPSVSHLLTELTGGRYFVNLGLSQAYLQLTVDDESAKLQTIITHRGAFKCTRLQFGVATARPCDLPVFH